MKAKTHLGYAIEAIDELKARYDKNVKEILSDVQVLARIVKHTVSEVEKLSIEQIMECIDPQSIRVGTVPVVPGLTNLDKIESIQPEDSIPNEGYVTFDIRFLLTNADSTIEIIINIEAQRSTDSQKLGYHLESRIVYYLARLISSQKGINFAKSEYDNIKKVYSIWICMDSKESGDSISRISLKADTLFGMPCEFPKLDKMCGIVIRIRETEPVTESQNKLIAMLEDVLSSEAGNQKKQKLEERYDMKITEELERRLDDMCNLSTAVEERGIEQGIERGIDIGIKGLVETLKELGTPREYIVDKIMEKFSLTEERAKRFVQ